MLRILFRPGEANKYSQRPCINEVLASIDVISHGQFGNWCIQHICEHGAPADRSRAIDHILRFATEYSMDQYASKVIEKCLKIGGNEFLDRYLERVCEARPDRPRMPLIDSKYAYQCWLALFTDALQSLETSSETTSFSTSSPTAAATTASWSLPTSASTWSLSEAPSTAPASPCSVATLQSPLVLARPLACSSTATTRTVLSVAMHTAASARARSRPCQVGTQLLVFSRRGCGVFGSRLDPKSIDWTSIVFLEKRLDLNSPLVYRISPDFRQLKRAQNYIVDHFPSTERAMSLSVANWIRTLI